MKQIFIICQSKGGSGKSFLTTLIAHKYEFDETVCFIDMDSSTETLKNQIAFIGKERFESANILNDGGKIERDTFIKFFESFEAIEKEKVFIDMGATESEQLYQFLKNDISPNEIKEYIENISCELSFVIPVAGNTATKSTSTYAKEMNELLSNDFPLFIMENIELTDSNSSLEIAKIVGKKVNFQQFGNTESDTERGIRIVDMIKNGLPSSSLSSLTKSKMKRLLEPIVF